jgi:hypothetical protein
MLTREVRFVKFEEIYEILIKFSLSPAHEKAPIFLINHLLLNFSARARQLLHLLSFSLSCRVLFEPKKVLVFLLMILTAHATYAPKTLFWNVKGQDCLYWMFD